VQYPGRKLAAGLRCAATIPVNNCLDAQAWCR
jgi:hypothetical protein